MLQCYLIDKNESQIFNFVAGIMICMYNGIGPWNIDMIRPNKMAADLQVAF